MPDTKVPRSFCQQCRKVPRPPYKPAIFEQGDYVRLKKDLRDSPYVYIIADTLRNIETGQWFVNLADRQGKTYWNENGYNWTSETEVMCQEIVTVMGVTQESRRSGETLEIVDAEEFGDEQTLIEFLSEERCD